jgi:hypothetical protein
MVYEALVASTHLNHNPNRRDTLLPSGTLHGLGDPAPVPVAYQAAENVDVTELPAESKGRSGGLPQSDMRLSGRSLWSPRHSAGPSGRAGRTDC